MKKLTLAIIVIIILIFAGLFLFKMFNKEIEVIKKKEPMAKSFELNNGMQVVVIPNTKVPAISHMVWYKIGAIDEPRGKSGIAHFLEHLMFKGTTLYPDGQFSKTIAKSGGEDNAFTSYDFTAYYQNISKNKLELVMSMESDRMQNLVFDEESVAKERNVILEERSARVDNDPSSLLSEQMRSILFKNHQYGTPLIGWRHEMEGLTLEDAHKWYKSYYAPNNAILVIAGDVTVGEVKLLAEKYYGSIPSKKIPARNFLTEPKPLSSSLVVLKDEKVKSPEWIRYYIAPSQNTEKSEYSFPLIVLSKILGEGNTSALYQDLVVDKELAVSVGSYYDDVNLGPSIFSIYAVPAIKTNINDLENAIEQSIENFIKNDINDEEMQRAKKSLISTSIYSKEDLKGLSYLFGAIVASDVEIDYIDKWEENINKVTKEQVIESAKYVLNNDLAVTGKLLPTDSKTN